jgi:hypothetical protein
MRDGSALERYPGDSAEPDLAEPDLAEPDLVEPASRREPLSPPADKGSPLRQRMT